MNTNLTILEFFQNNWILLCILIVLILNLVPPEWAGYWKYVNNDPAFGKAKKITILRFLLHGFVESIVSTFLVNIVSMFEFKKTVTVLIFFVVMFDVFINHEISTKVITLISIGILALYLEKLIETGKNIKLFGNLISWEKDDHTSHT